MVKRILAAVLLSVAAGSVLAQAASDPASAPAPAPAASDAQMGDYQTNAGLYVFVVGLAGLFALGFMGGMKR